MGNLEKVLAIIFLSINVSLSFLMQFTGKIIVVVWCIIIIILSLKTLPKLREEKALSTKQKRLMRKIEKSIPSMREDSMIKAIYLKEHPKKRGKKKV